MEREDKLLHLAYLVGTKVGMESLVKGLKTIKDLNGNQFNIEMIEDVAGSAITDIELLIMKSEEGKELLKKLVTEET